VHTHPEEINSGMDMQEFPRNHLGSVPFLQTWFYTTVTIGFLKKNCCAAEFMRDFALHEEFCR
jgi:hypothetical protein